MSEWMPIETAPKDGTVIEYKREIYGKEWFTGETSWRTYTFPAYDEFTEYEFTGWMRTDMDKKVPTPTHWKPKPPCPTK